MNIGIIGLGSMGKMLAEKFAHGYDNVTDKLLVSTRSKEKLTLMPENVGVCDNNRELAEHSDIVFLCLRPVDMRGVLEEITPCLKNDSLVVSLNGSISFAQLEKISDRSFAKVIPSVTAEIDRSQTLVCYNNKVTGEYKAALESLLSVIGDVVILPESEMGMGSELVSCMPGFISAMFDVICSSAGKHTGISHEQVVQMVLKTLSATSSLMLEKGMSFNEVVGRVATKGGITEEGTGVIYDSFPKTADELFDKTLEKRRITAEKAEKMFV